MKYLLSLSLSMIIMLCGKGQNARQYPSRTEIIIPIHKSSFNDSAACPERMQGGNPGMVNGLLTFNGSMDGNRQVDPQIAVGGGYVMHGTNSGLIIYNKKGEFIQGVSGGTTTSQKSNRSISLFLKPTILWGHGTLIPCLHKMVLMAVELDTAKNGLDTHFRVGKKEPLS